MRIRSFAPLLFLAAAALATSPGEARATAPTARTITLEPRLPHQVPAVHAADTYHRAPLSHAPAPLSTFSLLGLAVGATAKKSTRRSTGKASKLKMLLDSTVHLRRDPKKPDITVIEGGVLVDDTDLDDDEIEDLKRHGIIRPASAAEIARLETAADDADRVELIREHESQLTMLRAEQKAELDAAPADKRAALAERHGKALTALQDKQAKELGA